MPKRKKQSVAQKVKQVISEINPEGVFKDARAAGLKVYDVEDFRDQAHCYWRIEDIAKRYAGSAARYSAVGGLGAGIGGWPTAVSLSIFDLTNMAAQLYWLNQRVAILNGFDPQNPAQYEQSIEVYLYALGFDAAARALIKQQMLAAGRVAGKRGAYSNNILKAIILAGKQIGVQLNTKQAAKYIPFVGGGLGACLNYWFAKKSADLMVGKFKDEYFRTWQACQSQKSGSESTTASQKKGE